MADAGDFERLPTNRSASFESESSDKDSDVKSCACKEALQALVFSCSPAEKDEGRFGGSIFREQTQRYKFL